MRDFKRGIVGVLLFAAGILLISLYHTGSISGFAVLDNESAAEILKSPIAAFIVYVSGIILMLAGSGVVSGKLKVAGLESKLFYKDNEGNVLINDFKNELQQEGIPSGTPAEDALRRMHKYVENDPKLKEMFREIILKPYIDAARRQRYSLAGDHIKGHPEEAFADRFLKEWDPSYKPLVHKDVVPIELDKVDSDHMIVRHYTNPSRAQKILHTSKFGGATAPRDMDQGKVFIELGSSRILSPQEFLKRYAIPPTKKDLGKAYIEFAVPKKDVGSQINPRNGEKEYFLNATHTEHGKKVYEINSEIKVVKRK